MRYKRIIIQFVIVFLIMYFLVGIVAGGYIIPGGQYIGLISQIYLCLLVVGSVCITIIFEVLKCLKEKFSK